MSVATDIVKLDLMLFDHYSGKGQRLNAIDVDLAWAAIDFLEGQR